MIKILVVDDNPKDHPRYRAFLSKAGFEAVICTNAADALKKASDVGLAIVLWELKGPMRGSALLAGLRGSHPDLPLIAVSGHLDSSLTKAAKALGVRDFILKPLRDERLSSAVRAAMSPVVASPLMGRLREKFIGESGPLLNMLGEVAKVIEKSDGNVLLMGETGTGKGLIASEIHRLGRNAKGPFIATSLPADAPLLIESKLFGHEIGAFTGAFAQQIGCFEECKEGTLFLDEIGDLDSSLQPKLLRATEERTFRRIGGEKDLHFDGRLVCATNRDLPAEIRAGRFREDLYYRIATHVIRVPPLRERGKDIWLLIDHILANDVKGGKARLAPGARELLSQCAFPGNIRQLQKTLIDAFAKCDGDEIGPLDLPDMGGTPLDAGPDGAGAALGIAWPEHLFGLGMKEARDEIVDAFLRQYLPHKLAEAGGVRTRAADLAHVDKKTFDKKCKRLGVCPPLSDKPPKPDDEKPDAKEDD